MRGKRDPQATMLAFLDLETVVPPGHPLRPVKALADAALTALSPELDRLYAAIGRPSIPPERLLKASLIPAWLTPQPLHRRHCDDCRPTIRAGERSWSSSSSARNKPFARAS